MKLESILHSRVHPTVVLALDALLERIPPRLNSRQLTNALSAELARTQLVLVRVHRTPASAAQQARTHRLLGPAHQAHVLCVAQEPGLVWKGPQTARSALLEHTLIRQGSPVMERASCVQQVGSYAYYSRGTVNTSDRERERE